MITMDPKEFHAHLERLQLTHVAAGRALGVSHRQICNYLAGEVFIPDTIAILLRTKIALLTTLERLQELDPEWVNQPPRRQPSLAHALHP